MYLHSISFRPTCFGARPRTPGWVPVQQVELGIERFAMALRLLFAYPFIRPESEQNCSLLTRVYMPNRTSVPGRGHDTTALFWTQCRSFFDNIIAGCQPNLSLNDTCPDEVRR